MKERMIKYLNDTHPAKSRFMRIHVLVKAKLVFPGIKFLKWLLREYLVKDLNSIPNTWYNAHHRMFYWCWDRALEDEWRLHYYDTNPDNPKSKGLTSDEFYDKVRKTNKSHIFRMNIIQIWMTEMLEDTVDREWCNFFVMRMTHEMMKFYGVSEAEMKKVPMPGEFPIYKCGIQINPPYFMMNRHRRNWNPEASAPKKTMRDLEKENKQLSDYRLNKDAECEYLKKELDKMMNETKVVKK
jgi:hypothetical protein